MSVMQRDGLSARLEVLNKLSRERCRELLQYICMKLGVQEVGGGRSWITTLGEEFKS